jgi:hypothetical protein
MDAPPDTAEALFAAASRQHEAARFSEAGATLRRLLAIEPSHAGGLNLLGITLGQQGDLAANWSNKPSPLPPTTRSTCATCANFAARMTTLPVRWPPAAGPLPSPRTT